jgi:hypothetical protein
MNDGQQVRITSGSETITASLPCSLVTTSDLLKVETPGSPGEVMRFVKGAGAEVGVYLVCQPGDVLVNGRRVVTGVAYLAPGSHRLMVNGQRLSIMVSQPALRIVSKGEVREGLEECPVHHGPLEDIVAVCDRCGLICCAVCAQAGCPQCGLSREADESNVG